MRHTIIIATLSSVAASVLTTAVISGSLFGADAASSANTPVEAEGAVGPGGVTSILQGDVDCGGNVTPIDSLKTLRHDAGLSVQQDEPCPDIATVIPAGEGVPGPQGPAGPQGEPGISDYEIVSKTYTLSSDTAAGSWVTSNAYCPEGLEALGGGGHLTYNGGFNPAAYPGGYIISSVPVEQAGSGSWSVTWKHDDNGGFSGGTEFNAYAICAEVAE